MLKPVNKVWAVRQWASWDLAREDAAKTWWVFPAQSKEKDIVFSEQDQSGH